MSKVRKSVSQAESEGGEAAAAGRGRASNPYPQSDVAARNAWFSGYDGALEDMSRDKRRSRPKS